MAFITEMEAVKGRPLQRHGRGGASNCRTLVGRQTDAASKQHRRPPAEFEIGAGAPPGCAISTLNVSLAAQSTAFESIALMRSRRIDAMGATFSRKLNDSRVNLMQVVAQKQ